MSPPHTAEGHYVSLSVLTPCKQGLEVGSAQSSQKILPRQRPIDRSPSRYSSPIQRVILLPASCRCCPVAGDLASAGKGQQGSADQARGSPTVTALPKALLVEYRGSLCSCTMHQEISDWQGTSDFFSVPSGSQPHPSFPPQIGNRPPLEAEHFHSNVSQPSSSRNCNLQNLKNTLDIYFFIP